MRVRPSCLGSAWTKVQQVPWALQVLFPATSIG